LIYHSFERDHFPDSSTKTTVIYKTQSDTPSVKCDSFCTQLY